MLLTAISLIETTLNSHYLKHTKQLHIANVPAYNYTRDITKHNFKKYVNKNCVNAI